MEGRNGGKKGGGEYRKVDRREARRNLSLTHCGQHISFIPKLAKLCLLWAYSESETMSDMKETPAYVINMVPILKLLIF